MLLRKYGHSCILLEDAGKRLLIDPGAFTFGPGLLSPSSVGAVDAVLITHAHPDHYAPDVLRAIQHQSQPNAPTPMPVYTNPELAQAAAKDGFHAQTIAFGQSKRVAGFTVEAFGAPHGTMPIPVPTNVAFRVNGKVLHPGDSYAVQGSPTCDVLCLPVAAPWGRLVDALEFARQFKAQKFVGIHDDLYVPAMKMRAHQMARDNLENSGLEYYALTHSETLEI